MGAAGRAVRFGSCMCRVKQVVGSRRPGVVPGFPNHGSREQGGGTVLAIAVVVATALVFGVLARFVDVVNGSRDAVALAEDAALTASQFSLDYTAAVACAEAEKIVAANSAVLTTCTRHISEFTVEISVNGITATAVAGPREPSM